MKTSIRGLMSLTIACLILAGCKSAPPVQQAAQPPTGQPATQQPGAGGQTATAPPNQYPPSQTSSQSAPAPSQYPNNPPAQSAPQYPQQGGSAYPASSAEPVRQAALVIPAGTPLRVRLDQTLSSRQNQPGDSFTATIEAPVIVHGETIVKRGSTATGTVTEAKGLGHIKGQAVLAIRLDEVRANGRVYRVSTSSIARIEKGKGRRSAEFAGGGAGLGALIGGLAGGGKGALIGALAGGGAGTATGAMTGNKDLVLPAETLLTFRITHDVHVE